MLNVQRCMNRFLGILLLGGALSHCQKVGENSTTQGFTAGGKPLATAIREEYSVCRVASKSLAPSCKVQAFDRALTQAGLRSPVARSGGDMRAMVSDLNRRRFAVVKACKEPGGLEGTFPNECQALAGAGDTQRLIDALRMIGGFTAETLNRFLQTRSILELVVVIVLSRNFYDVSDKSWGNVENINVSPRRAVKNCTSSLGWLEKVVIDRKYSSAKRYPIQMMSRDYVAQHAFESMRNVDSRYRLIDCAIRSVGVALCTDPAPLYKYRMYFADSAEINNKKDYTDAFPIKKDELNSAINLVLRNNDPSFSREAYQWPTVVDDLVTMADGAASKLVENGGVGTYIGYYLPVPDEKREGGHAVVVSVHRDAATGGGYRIYTHDFQVFSQYEGLPLPAVKGSLFTDLRTAYGYNFIKVSMEPFPLDSNAKNVLGTAIEAASEKLLKAPK